LEFRRVLFRSLPLQFPEGENAESLGLDGTETFSVTGVTALNEGEIPKTVKVVATKDDAAEGASVEFDAVVRIDTPGEAEYFRNGASCSTCSARSPPDTRRVRSERSGRCRTAPGRRTAARAPRQVPPGGARAFSSASAGGRAASVRVLPRAARRERKGTPLNSSHVS